MMPAHLLVPEVVHRHQDAAVRRLEPVAHVRQGAADDDGLGVGQVAVPQLVEDVERVDRRDGGRGGVGLVRRWYWVGQGDSFDCTIPAGRAAGTWPFSGRTTGRESFRFVL
jgi:hypothetical protein